MRLFLMALCASSIFILPSLAITDSINLNQAERIASDATGGIPNGNAEKRDENGHDYWFVQVEVQHKLMVVKIGAESGKIYEIWEYGNRSHQKK